MCIQKIVPLPCEWWVHQCQHRSSPSPSSTSPTTSAPLSQSTIRKPSISIECASAILTFVDLILTANERMSNEAQAQPAIAIIPIVQDEALVVNHVLHILRLSCVHITTSSSWINSGQGWFRTKSDSRFGQRKKLVSLTLYNVSTIYIFSCGGHFNKFKFVCALTWDFSYLFSLYLFLSFAHLCW